MNYNYISVIEAAQKEIAEKFIINIKQLDAKVSQNRLSCLVRSNKMDVSAINIMAQFNSLMGHETSADET